ncbi:putative tricarboxylic transport membrane protein [Cryobacterium flavum]|uniref:Putative tricarboxylic transport membrane protein n=1 Tax=Cryobacterium flavum TaxID=1424659 RepID=A0A4R8VH43_9MICO|nr:tripartite tricarboxylate transporter TctB family protein [Cryobacterium flavum]TFB82307.1 tripartite tricarboxylate transporter TctB family protein [Cryobacterium flavum]SDN96536.1 putative tricarboxylic transport membrane protein [Cryobacterium flavum]
MGRQAVLRKINTGDFWAGLGIAILGTVGWIGSLQIFEPRGISGFLGPRTFPIAVSMAMLVLGLTVLVRGIVKPRAPEESVGSVRELGVLCSAIVVYLVIFPLLGFVTSTFLLLSGLFSYLGERRYWLSAIVAAVLSVLTFLCFSSGLNVALPTGPFGF